MRGKHKSRIKVPCSLFYNIAVLSDRFQFRFKASNVGLAICRVYLLLTTM